MPCFIRSGKFHGQNELEIENYYNFKKVIKMNKKKVILAPFLLFNRFSCISQRNCRQRSTLAYKLAVFPMNLFDMRDSHKAEIGRNVKDKIFTQFSTVTSCHADNTFIDRGWLIKYLGHLESVLFYLPIFYFPRTTIISAEHNIPIDLSKFQ